MNARQGHAEDARDGKALGVDLLQHGDGARRVAFRVEAIAIAHRLEPPDIGHHVGDVQNAVGIVEARVEGARRRDRLREGGAELRHHGLAARGGQGGDLEPLLPDREVHRRRPRPRERERVVVHLAHVHLGGASGPAELVADDERAAGAALHEQDGLAVPQQLREESRDLRVRVASRAHDEDVGAVDGRGEVRRRHLDGCEALEQAVDLDARPGRESPSSRLSSRSCSRMR